MIRVNRVEVTREDFEQILINVSQQQAMEHVSGKVLALCISDPTHLLACIHYVRSQHGSILLIHGETPQQQAIQLAQQAGCHGLLWGNYDTYIPVDPSASLQEDAFLYQYSSGTTGDAKLIKRRWTHIDTEIAAYNQALGGDEEEVPIVLVPMSHSYGLICGVLASLARGATPILITNRNPKLTWSIIRENPKHIVYGIPSLYHVLLGFSSETTSMDRVMSSGAPMSDSLLGQLQARANYVMQQYGCSETGCISLSQQVSSSSDVGTPLHHLQVQTGDSANNRTEIEIVAGESTHSTKDIGFWSPDRQLQVIGRIDDVINVSGLKVFPQEVESMISMLPEVNEAVVYRGIHPIIGECVQAQVVLRAPLEVKAIRDWCIQNLPPYKVPAEIEIVDEIRKMPSGKISRRLLEQGGS
ncbi:AMP-binding protein [Paenibacillus sp. SC116]|uniref:AMP-binding protein n=1 Tax=Paenibacillus sp. SC116 TaxID=2968986 RepID=UPI00215A35D8|nr:AMP-binding protein [Paenibacillus sp. SC116]MCR8843214.1 AMP-binding protein [Paenibacillus sp. SC116]